MDINKNEVNIFFYWDKGLINLPPMLKTIYDSNILICNEFNMNLHFIDDNNVHDYIDVPSRYHKLKPNYKSDIIRYFILHKFGGFWFDCDVIIIKDLHQIFSEFLESSFDIILDVEHKNKNIGCASLCMKQNSIASKFCVDHVNSYLNSHQKIHWNCLGPNTVRKLYRVHCNIVNLHKRNIVKHGCNFICHHMIPGKNKKKWFRKTDEIAYDRASILKNKETCHYVLTWTIYRKNNIKCNIVDLVFRNKRSIFTYLIHKDTLN